MVSQDLQGFVCQCQVSIPLERDNNILPQTKECLDVIVREAKKLRLLQTIIRGRDHESTLFTYPSFSNRCLLLRILVNPLPRPNSNFDQGFVQEMGEDNVLKKFVGENCFRVEQRRQV